MQFNYGNSANYLAGGEQVANTYIDTYDTSQKTGTDINKLVQAQSKRRKQQEVNAINQVTTVGDKAVDIQTGMKITDMDAKLKKDIAKIQKPAKMAGALASTVNLGNTGLMLHQDMKLNQKEAAERKEWRAEQTRIAKEGQAMTKADNEKTDAMLKRILESSGYSMDADGMPVMNTTNTPSGSIPINNPVSTVKPITPSGGTIDRKDVYQYITKDLGLSHNKAYGLMANIDRESSFIPNIRSGDDRGPGGLFQWKGVRQTPTVAKLVNSGDWKGQIKYAINEPGEPSMQTFLNTTWKSPQDAAAHITRKFERPANPDNDILKNNQFIAGYNYQ
jgi:hypothetical protein